ncbi:cation diffusion facilitator family transporter [Hwanghaeella sp.]|uniref:cation diffusion facilitator family transporter n=1 Tax=Hwanghaeella sp. TaxID=2605943 RepID=UPI003CCC419B
MSKDLPARRVIMVSFLVDLLDILTNLIVALLTGSAVVFSEMAQGVADGIGSGLLVLGERRAAKPRDAAHPLGYAREAFFWGLLSAGAMLVLGAGLSAWRGMQQLLDPQPLDTPLLAVAVLVLAVFTNSYAVVLSARKLGFPGCGLKAIFRRFDEPLVKGAFFRDVIGTFTSLVGLAALILYSTLEIVVFDALGALFAAVCMAAGSILLMAQARALITGRSLPREDVETLRNAILADPMVDAVNSLAAIYAGASEVLVDADLDLSEDLSTSEIEQALDAIEDRIRTVMPSINRVRVLLNSPDFRRERGAKGKGAAHGAP